MANRRSSSRRPERASESCGERLTMAYFARGIGNGSCKKADELAQAHRRCGWSPEPSERLFCVFDCALVNDHVGAAPIFAELRESCGTDSAPMLDGTGNDCNRYGRSAVMQATKGQLALSPSDLKDYVECPHLTTLGL